MIYLRGQHDYMLTELRQLGSRANLDQCERISVFPLEGVKDQRSDIGLGSLQETVCW